MFSASAVVTSEIVGLKFEEIEYSSDFPHVSKSTISCIDGKVIASNIELMGVSEFDMLAEIAAEVHELAVRRLELQYGPHASPSNVVLSNVVDANAPDDAVQLRATMSSHSSVSATATLEFHSPASIAALRELIEKPKSSSDVWAEVLHQARDSRNPVVEFTGYHQVIAAQHQDDQKLIDNFVRVHERGVAESVSPRSKPGKPPLYETVYTRLRNELMHVRDYERPRPLAELYKEIAAAVPGLRRLAKVAIST